MSPSEFRELCVSHFDFLASDYDCHVSFPEPDPLIPDHLCGYEVFFQNSTTGISIKLEVSEKLPTVHIHRLHQTDAEQNVFALGLLLLVRAPDLNPLKHETGFPLSKTIQTFIIEYAQALKVAAKDVLEGDFRVFPELQKEWQRQGELRANRNSSRFTYF
jgi:hypothetical protein